MSADTDGGTDHAERFTPNAIRRRLPSGLSDKQIRALICAIRNPDASYGRIATATNTSDSTVINALEALARGVVGRGSQNTGEWIQTRDGSNYAETFDELTERQQAVVDFLARHPSFDVSAHTGRELDAAVRNYNPDAPDMSTTYSKKVAETYDDLIDSYRDKLRAMGEDLNGDASTENTRPDSPREWLNAAGITNLPDTNMDTLDDTRLGEFATASEIQNDDTDTDTDTDTGPQAGPTVANHLGEDRDTFDDDDVQPGQTYVGIVNGKVSWGVWVTIGGDRTDPDDVSGVVSREVLARSDRTVDDYEVGDILGVVASGETSNTDDGKVRHRFYLPGGEDVLDNPMSYVPTRDTDGAATASDDDSAGEDTTDTENDATAPQDGEDDDRANTGDDHPVDGPPHPHDQSSGGYTSPRGIDDDDAASADDVAELDEHVEALSRRLDHVAEQVDENGEALPDAETAADLNEAAETVLGAETTIDALADRLDEVEDRRGRVEHTADKAATSAETALDRIDEVTERLDEVEDRLYDLSDRLDYLDALESDVDHIGEELADALGRIDDLEADDTGSGATTLVDAIEALEASGVAYEITATNDTDTDTETHE